MTVRAWYLAPSKNRPKHSPYGLVTQPVVISEEIKVASTNDLERILNGGFNSKDEDGNFIRYFVAPAAILGYEILD